MAGRMLSGTAALAGLIRPASDTDEAGVHRVLPVPPELSGLLPSRGLRRGSTVAVASGPASGNGASSGLAVPGSDALSGLAASGRGVSSGLAAPGGASAGVVAPGGASAGVVAPGGASAGLVAPGGASAGLVASGSGGTSLLLSLLSAASQSGSWCAVVGVPALGALAAAESGIALDRLALVPNPGPDWPTVVAALIDGVDVVVVAVPGPVSGSITSRLVARARQRGSVLVALGPWAGADVTLQVVHGEWEGLDAGHGRLRRRLVTITARGRGAAARPREVTLWMPGTTAPPPPSEPPPARSDPGGGATWAARGGLTAAPAAVGDGTPAAAARDAADVHAPADGDGTVVAGAFGRAEPAAGQTEAPPGRTDPQERRRTILTAVS